MAFGHMIDFIEVLEDRGSWKQFILIVAHTCSQKSFDYFFSCIIWLLLSVISLHSYYLLLCYLSHSLNIVTLLYILFYLYLFFFLFLSNYILRNSPSFEIAYPNIFPNTFFPKRNPSPKYPFCSENPHTPSLGNALSALQGRDPF